MCACFSRGQAGGRGLLFLQMKHNDRVIRNNEGDNFRVSMLSGDYYFYYLPAATTLIYSYQVLILPSSSLSNGQFPLQR